MAAAIRARGTQSFVRVLSECWSRPGLLALELLWRWLFGIPLLAILIWQGLRIYSAVAERVTAGAGQLSLADPMGAAPVIADVYAILTPLILHASMWLLPIAAPACAIASGVGRNAVLRRYDTSLPRRRITLSALQFLRIIFLGGSFWLWLVTVQWAANYSLSGEDPNLVVYSTLVIFISLGIFIAWAVVSWVFSIAPLLVLLEHRGIASSLLRSFRLGPLTGKLVEINLVMGIVKLALIVLAMVFSAVPLPFESVVQGTSLYIWWVVVTLVYLVASDFFQVARLVAFVELWRVVPSHSLSAKTSFQVK